MEDAAEPAAPHVSSVNATNYTRYILIGLIGTLVLLFEPVDTFVDTNLTLHMFQHIGLFVSAAVFGYGLERYLITKLLSLKRRTYIGWKLFTSIMIFNTRTKGLVFAAVIPSIIFAFWHFPSNFDLTLTNLYAHLLEHTSYIIAGSLVGLSIVAIPRRWKIVLLYFAFMQAGMMGSMMLIWPSFFPVYSASQNTTMDGALMMFGAFGIIGLSSRLLKSLDII